MITRSFRLIQRLSNLPSGVSVMRYQLSCVSLTRGALFAFPFAHICVNLKLLDLEHLPQFLSVTFSRSYDPDARSLISANVSFAAVSAK